MYRKGGYLIGIWSAWYLPPRKLSEIFLAAPPARGAKTEWWEMTPWAFRDCVHGARDGPRRDCVLTCRNRTVSVLLSLHCPGACMKNLSF